MYNTDLDIMVMLWFHGILQRNYRKMTMRRSFSYNYFCKIALYNTIHLSVLHIAHCKYWPNQRILDLWKAINLCFTSNYFYNSDKYLLMFILPVNG